MYISDLALQGFKSFANKEKLSFGEGITAVVGPNGCGKTNIVDAIRWVLGEQKYSTLRSSRMEDIIFSGSESKRPVNVCEVSLVVHNNRGILPLDYNDVEIARRIFRNGESQYMINRGKCRLKDIQDLFVDTGMGADAYSVIELKMIEDILSENADDRRRMFEEAAGINKYKHQRKTTLNRLELTKSDLDRVGDIIAEVDTKVNALRLQLKRFDRHIKMTHKLREYELELAFIQKSELEEKIIPLNENIQSLTLHQSTSKDAEKGREDVLDKLRAISKSQQEEMSAIQERIDSLSANKHEKSNRILILNEQTKTAERDIIRADNESEESNIRIDGYQQAMKTVKKELENVDPLVDAKLSEYNEAKTKLEQNNIAFTNSQQSFDELTGQLMQRHKEENDMKSLLERSEFLLADRVKQKQELSNQADEIVE
ncbi:MAG TPA: AAA family ATPase, partial [Candidatus Marinimicrobia bacterium]|nr:AAA family ATPase [Candidatus Neomarinimicrobiota bacterium]